MKRMKKAVKPCNPHATMFKQGLDVLRPENPDIIIIENVGNLVCPAEFDAGAYKKAMILSVPEGDDKPLKYPLMFSVCDVLVMNKFDYMPFQIHDLRVHSHTE